MLYSILKIITRIAIRIFCRKIIINKPELLKEKGPLLIAANHPNSFLDSIILDTLFDQPVWSLARGDVFVKPFYIRLLHSLKILPVYRTSEGLENLSGNYKTFEDCITIFKQKGLVTIFSEGKCINEWHLRPLKKGTARLAFKAWEEDIPLKVLPVGINYSSFHRFGKNMFINFGDPIEQKDFRMEQADGMRYQQFNEQLDAQLKQLVYEIPKADKQMQKARLEVKTSSLSKIILAIPALPGWLIHAPLFYLLKAFTWPRTKDNDHYDSVMTALLLLLYPFYLGLLVTLSIVFFREWWAWLFLLLAPFTAWAYVQIKKQVN